MLSVVVVGYFDGFLNREQFRLSALVKVVTRGIILELSNGSGLIFDASS